VSPSSPTTTFAGQFTASNQEYPTVACNSTPQGSECDNFTLHVGGVSDATHVVSTTITYAKPSGQEELDLYIFDSTGNQIAAENTTANSPKTVSFPAVTGAYTVTVVPSMIVAPNEQYTAAITLTNQPPSTGPGTGPMSATVAAPTDPRYQNYVAPNGLGTTAGEPSIGVNWNTGKVMYRSDLQTLQVAFDDSNPATATSPARAAWKDVSFATTSKESLDPILFEDSPLGRTFEGQLVGPSAAVARTDDDGATYTPTVIGPTNDVDHETIGGGPMATQVTTLTQGLAPSTHVYYYCTQGIADAGCQASLDGGQSFVETGKMYTLSQCGGLHGHIKVAPDGTAYVPNKSCNGKQAVAVSTTDSLTWTVRTVPDSTAGDWDPSVGVGLNNTGLPAGQASNTVYFGYDDANHHAKIAVSHDQGQTWSPSIDVGAPFGIQNIAFPTVVAGDDNRAAYAFLGSPTAGAGGSSNAADFNGIWHLYVAFTYDGGATWKTVDATPNDPVQRGPICSQGTTCMGSPNTRNLLDFIDSTVDNQGRVLVGYADGCIDACVQSGTNTKNNGYDALATIARQSSGLPLFATPPGTGTGGTTPTATPEPGSGVLYATGLAGLLAALQLWRRRARPASPVRTETEEDS